MTDDFCPVETRTVEAVKSGHWPADLQSHIAGCSLCEEARTVASFMSRTAGHFGSSETVPDPMLIWVKSMLARRDEEAKGERRARLWSRGLIGLAATVVGWAAVQWIPPALMLNTEVLAATGAAIALTLAILYFAAYRPLKNAFR